MGDECEHSFVGSITALGYQAHCQKCGLGIRQDAENSCRDELARENERLRAALKAQRGSGESDGD